jgi:hypothetical protein
MKHFYLSFSNNSFLHLIRRGNRESNKEVCSIIKDTESKRLEIFLKKHFNKFRYSYQEEEKDITRRLLCCFGCRFDNWIFGADQEA